MLLRFVQFEFAGLIGLSDGRYLSRGSDTQAGPGREAEEPASSQVLIVQVIGTPRPSRRARRKPQPASPGDPDAVPLTRVTVADAEPFSGEAEAAKWLDATVSDSERRGAAVRSGTRLLNRALSALRAEARDPLVQELGATTALKVRIGYGEGDALAEGRWSEARDLPPPQRGRRAELDPQSRIAAVLGGRDSVHPAETLIQRARLDIQQGRLPEAELGLQGAEQALAAIDGRRNADLREQLVEARRKLDES
jgi:hypothetical protein